MSYTVETNDSKNNNSAELVGYGRPPRATRFKKGQSGNPKGRPKGRKELPAIVSDMLYETISAQEGNRRRRIPKVEAAFKVCLNNALKGDLRAFEKLLQLAIKLKVFDRLPGDISITKIRRVIVYPDGIERPLPL